MDELDSQIERALSRKPSAGKPGKGIKPDGPTMTRPLRSWALVIRANDARLESICPIKLIGHHDWDEEFPDYDGPECAIEAVIITRDALRELVRPISIPWPGISIDAMARTCGVNRSTIHRWIKKGLLTMEVHAKRNGRDLHRAHKTVWTPSPPGNLDPNGQIMSGPVCKEKEFRGRGWNVDHETLTDRLPEDWSQTLIRSHRCLGTKSVCRFWNCPLCDRWVYKMYLPMKVWTVPMALGMSDSVGGNDPRLTTFICRHCAKMIYESGEKTSPLAMVRKQVDTWDLFIRRLTAGQLRGRDIRS